MLRSLWRPRRGGILASIVTAAAAASFALAGPTGATVEPAANHFVIGSGSQTAYGVVQQLDDLFNSSPGCTLVAKSGSVQPLNFGCVSSAKALTGGNTENPYNDVAIEEPPLGGKNGLLQLENQSKGGSTEETAPIDYATGPRLPTASDPTGLNFVSYAKDALTWFHFTEVHGAKTPSASIPSLTPTQLANIWDGTYTKWDQILNPKTAKPYYTGTAPIHPYAVNSGSGLLSLWNSDLGGSSYNSQTYILDTPGLGKSHIIEQNEDASIIANKDEADAIFLFSDGRFRQTCKTVCGGTKVPGKGVSKAVLGEVNGVALNTADILDGRWPFPIWLTNIYSDGHNPAIPAATQATLNLVSEDGFVCKANLAKGKPILDPNTGVAYHTRQKTATGLPGGEIASVIEAEGFVPLPFGDEGLSAFPAKITDPAYKLYDKPTIAKNGQPEGFCHLVSTDGT